MGEYIIKKEKKKKKVINRKNKVSTIEMKPKMKKRKNLIEVKEITLIDQKLKEQVCRIQFDNMFKRMKSIVFSIIKDSDSESGDVFIALNDIKRAKMILLDEYIHTLSKEEVRKMLKKLTVLEKELQDYIVKINKINEMNYYEEEEREKGKSR